MSDWAPVLRFFAERGVRAWAFTVILALMLWLPDSAMESIGLLETRAEFKGWLGLGFAAVLAMALAATAQWIIDAAKRGRERDEEQRAERKEGEEVANDLQKNIDRAAPEERELLEAVVRSSRDTFTVPFEDMGKHATAIRLVERGLVLPVGQGLVNATFKVPAPIFDHVQSRLPPETRPEQSEKDGSV